MGLRQTVIHSAPEPYVLSCILCQSATLRFIIGKEPCAIDEFKAVPRILDEQGGTEPERVWHAG